MKRQESKACPQLDWGSLLSGFNSAESRISDYQNEKIFWL
jgi:hypothetical protein